MPARKKPSSSSSQSNNNNNKRKRKDDVSSDEEESDHEELASQPLTANGTKKTKPNSICGYQLPKMRDGSIVRIKIHNFMTYDDCEFFPGPGLNLVLGPNGTGEFQLITLNSLIKSSINNFIKLTLILLSNNQQVKVQLLELFVLD